MQLKTAASMTTMLCAFAAQNALAGTAAWTDWNADTSNTVTGTLATRSGPVSVTYSGAQYSFAQINGAGINYWQPSPPYLSDTVSNAPPTPDIIGLSAAGTSTITFSAPVLNPVIALVSWNGANVTFGGGADQQTYNISYLSSGCGYWGCGSYGNPTSNSFFGSGQLHGVIELLGTYQTITFTDSMPEDWHGLTVGVAAAPEPGLNLSFITHPDPGDIILRGFGVPNTAYTIEVSSDLTSGFSYLATVTSGGAGTIYFDDTGAAGVTKRFYRLTFP
jgi:hypothetical protein